MASFVTKLLQIEEPFANTAERREKVQQLSDEARLELESKLTDLKADAGRIGQQALLIGGSIAAVYLILDWMVGDDDDEGESEQVKTRRESPWYVKAVSGYVLTMLLGVARQRLVEFLATQHGANEEKNT